jgi:hypothetical protein
VNSQQNGQYENETADYFGLGGVHISRRHPLRQRQHGAYEFQSPQSTISYAWLERYGLPISNSTDTADPDGDGHSNWQEWRAWTDPTHSASALRLLSPTIVTNGVLVRWESVSGRSYFLERSTNVGISSAFTPVATTVWGLAGTTAFVDTNAVSPGPFFYRVGVGD